MRAKCLSLGVLLLVIATSGVLAQTTSYEIRSGELLAVEGNVVTVRGPEGVRQFVVPPEFRFDVEGRSVPLSELKPGMKLTAMIKTTETPIEMVETKVVNAEVLKTIGTSVVVRTGSGEIKRFTTEDMKSRNIVIYRDGQPISLAQLKQGDRVSASIVTKLPPETLTETELQVWAQNAPAAPPIAAARPPAPAPTPVAAPPAPPAPAAAPSPAQLPKTGSLRALLLLAGLTALGAAGGSTLIRRFTA